MLPLYDRTSGESGISQYRNFLDNQIYLRELHRDIKDPINYQLVELRKAIQRNTSDIKSSIYESIETVYGSLESGFSQIENNLHEATQGLSDLNEGIADVNWRLNEINENVLELISLINWKTDIIIQQQKVSNAYLAEIAKAAYLTESDKINIQCNKRGDILLKTANVQGPKSEFYIKARDEFEKAKNAVPTDYHCLEQLGYIYLNSQILLDAHKAEAVYTAESLFIESAELALAFDYGSPNQSLIDSAASSLSNASFCNYYLDDLNKAIELVRRAIDLAPGIQKYKFQLAQCLVASGDESEAVNILREIMLREKLYFEIIKEDPNLIAKKSIRYMLDEEEEKVISEVELAISEIKPIAFNQKFSLLINSIEADFNPKTYINARIAKDKLRI